VRRLLVIVFLLLNAALGSVDGRVLPLTLKDVCLMLRSGYSSEAVQRELSVRHLAETCDAAGESALRGAGASPSLIDAIKGGAYQTSRTDALAALEQRTAQAQRQALETERLRKMNSLYQGQRARERAARPLESRPAVADLVKGDLVYWNNGSMDRFDDETFASKKLIALYFAANWCPACRQFTPQLVEYYNRVKAEHPEFEIILVSGDPSAAGMEAHIRSGRMPWPAVDFEKLPGKESLKKYGGQSIPCLVLLDASGKVLADTFEGKTRVGPEKVLATLDAIFARGRAGQVAEAR
jgi:nucleoredoxin